MLSILVCHSYFLRLDQKQIARAKPYPPIWGASAAGLALLATGWYLLRTRVFTPETLLTKVREVLDARRDNSKRNIS